MSKNNQDQGFKEEDLNLNNPIIQKNIESLITVKEDQHGQAAEFFKNYNYMYVDKDKIRKILINLEYAGMTKELQNYPNNYAKTMNLVIFGSFFSIIKLFKSNSKRFFLGGSILFLKGFYFDYLMNDWHFRKIGYTENNAFSQELRNLYRFYYQDDPIAEDFVPLCKDYLEVHNIRKELHKAKSRF